MKAASTVPSSHVLSFPLTNQGQIFNSMSLIYNPPPTLVITTTSRSNHWSRCPKPQAQTAVTHFFLLSHLFPPLSQLVFCLRKGAIFFCFDLHPPPNPSDLAASVLHPPRSLSFPIYLSFPQSFTLSSFFHRVYRVYVVNKCFYFDFWLC